MKRKVLASIIISNIGLVDLAYAKEDNLINLSLEESINSQIITSSKYLEKAVDSPANIHIITAKQIKDRGYKNLEDLLRNMLSVDLQEYAAIGNYNVISMRGARSNNKFLILKDGVRLSTPAGEINAIANNYPLYFAKRVEVLIGPASVTYGADAFAGVINIISSDKDNADYTQVSVSVGDAHYLNGNAQYSRLFNNGVFVNIGIQGHYSQELNFSDNYPELYNDNSIDYNFKNTENFQFFADTTITENYSMGVFHSKITYSSDFTATPESSSFDHSSLEESLTNIYASFNYTFNEKLQTQTLFTYQLFTLGNASHVNNIFTHYTKQYKYGRTARYSLNQDLTYQLNQSHLLSGGIVYDYFDIIPRSPNLAEPYEADNKPDEQILFYPNTELAVEFFQHRDESVGFYLQDNWQINDKWRQVIGIRYDHHSLYGGTVSPKLSTIYQADAHNVFKLLYAHSFLTPSSSQAFNSAGSFTGEKNEQDEWLSSPLTAFSVPNEQLQPETLKSLELNYEHWFNPQSTIKFAPFYNKINNVIIGSNDETAKQAISGAYLTKTSSYKNSGQSTAYGIDISINSTISYDKSNTEYWLALSYIDGELTEQGIETDLPLIAHYKIKTGLTFNYQNNHYRYVFSPTLRWISNTTGNNLVINSQNERTEIDSYFVVDLHGEAQLTNNLTLKLTVNNLLDEKYYHAPFDSDLVAFNKAPQVGRLVFATVEYGF
ncbi:TonB-dependent receptor plug domain-containing protein [Candidatus Colwellia aromaticivorans]|uniref:TonB-dependent receptor plug domain-containing protein n=1 Tax=Candidatus Colwellia aromaticivorans TaxID=2267621 RepID=UPI000DF3A61C|nr:TonB-dependent receptor [Candidatus Colwellia aromaticivorans]